MARYLCYAFIQQISMLSCGQEREESASPARCDFPGLGGDEGFRALLLASPPTCADMATRQRSAGVRRLLQEAQELEQDDCADYAAQPLEVRPSSQPCPRPERVWKLTLAPAYRPTSSSGTSRCAVPRGATTKVRRGSPPRRHARLSRAIERACEDDD